jgi:DNA polymerase III gamma/tau subunit
MLMLKQWQRQTLQQAQDAEVKALTLARNSLAQVRAVEGQLTAFEGQYTQFTTSFVASTMAQQIEAQMNAQPSHNRRTAALYGEPEASQSSAGEPISPAPNRAELLGAIRQLGSGKTDLLATIQTLEKSTTDRAAQISALDNGGQQ